jgi:hypothetical protein
VINRLVPSEQPGSVDHEGAVGVVINRLVPPEQQESADHEGAVAARVS